MGLARLLAGRYEFDIMIRELTEYIVLHTAAWPGDPSIHDIRRVHVDERGWDDVGYHYLVRKDGTIEAGRHESKKGAHCRSMHMNSKSIGICLSGHGDEEPMTDIQKEALYKLCIDIMNAHDIPAEKIIGHRETGANKTCPGELVNMTEIRSELKELNPDSIFS